MQRGTAPQISPFSLWQNLPFHEANIYTNLQGINQCTHIRLTREIWNPILEKMQLRLVGWKKLYFSKGGKLTLIKSTLPSMPTYFLSPFPFPSIHALIEKFAERFSMG